MVPVNPHVNGKVEFLKQLWDQRRSTEINSEVNTPCQTKWLLLVHVSFSQFCSKAADVPSASFEETNSHFAFFWISPVLFTLFYSAFFVCTETAATKKTPPVSGDLCRCLGDGGCTSEPWQRFISSPDISGT